MNRADEEHEQQYPVDIIPPDEGDRLICRRKTNSVMEITDLSSQSVYTEPTKGCVNAVRKERGFSLIPPGQEKDLRKTPSVDRRCRQAGFSMVEMGVAVGMAAILAAFAVVNLVGISPGTASNAAMAQTIAQLRRGRETAVAQRRNIQLVFAGNDQIQLIRFDQPGGQTLLSTVDFAGGIQYQLFGDVPDTPDAFGRTAAISFGGAPMYQWLSDGTLVDANLNPLNGTVFLGQPGNSKTARAVTILGTTGRVRGYRWTGSTWIQ